MISGTMEGNTVELLVRRYWPEECDALGESVVRDVVTGDHELTPVPGASYIDLVEIIKAVADAVVTIKAIVEIQKLLREQLGREPNSKEVENKVSERGINAESPEKTHLIVLDLCRSPQRTSS